MDFETVDQSNQDRAARVLADAFHDDPVMNWSCNHPPDLLPFFEFTLPVFVAHGLTYLDSRDRGVASWLGPGETLNWPLRFSSVATILKQGGLRGFYRMLLSGHQTEKHHPKTPHYYLFVIGVTPDHKGQGLGTALISHQLRNCDAQGMPAYLENSKEQNLPFYEGHGFRVMKEIRFAPSAPPLWLMWREPGEAGR